MRLCKRCTDRLEISRPPVRTAEGNCEACGAEGLPPRNLNYSIPDIQIPNSSEDPNLLAEREDHDEGGGGGSAVHAGARPATKGA
jgi:hypothetical protein